MTPFKEAGYTKDTKFRVLVGYGQLREGDIVTLYGDGYLISPRFKTEDGRTGRAFLPSMAPEREPEELEVYEVPKKLTPPPKTKLPHTKETLYQEIVHSDYLKAIKVRFKRNGKLHRIVSEYTTPGVTAWVTMCEMYDVGDDIGYTLKLSYDGFEEINKKYVHIEEETVMFDDLYFETEQEFKELLFNTLEIIGYDEHD